MKIVFRFMDNVQACLNKVIVVVSFSFLFAIDHLNVIRKSDVKSLHDWIS